VAVTLKKEKIIDRWSMVVKDGQGKAEEVFKDTGNYIQKSEAPGVKAERVQVRASFLKGVLGEERTFIRVLNKDLKHYKMYIGVRDYGNNLDLSWYLTFEPGFISRLISRLLGFLSKKTYVPDLDLFQQQDLAAYSTVVHHCFINAIEKITKGTGQAIDRKSKGFLGIS